MNAKTQELIERLALTHRLEAEEYATLIDARDEESASFLADFAVEARQRIYGNAVYTRGLIEISNICKNDCLYCGIRRSNPHIDRYRLSPEEILACCDEGYTLGFRTFVLQAGEDAWFTDDILVNLIAAIKTAHPDCAITLSLGERGYDSFKRLYDAGADRYLLRHETADRAHYEKLHPAGMSFDNRMKCLADLREIGYQVGCGFMVGSPCQTTESLVKDLRFIERFHPDMCGIGPFVPHHDTVFRDMPRGTLELTTYLLSIIRLIQPDILLPATTALATIDPQGREKGILAGANVVMPNLSPVSVREKYALYDGKVCTGEEAAQCRFCLDRRMESVGYQIVVARGDIKKSS